MDFSNLTNLPITHLPEGVQYSLEKDGPVCIVGYTAATPSNPANTTALKFDLLINGNWFDKHLGYCLRYPYSTQPILDKLSENPITDAWLRNALLLYAPFPYWRLESIHPVIGSTTLNTAKLHLENQDYPERYWSAYDGVEPVFHKATDSLHVRRYAQTFQKIQSHYARILARRDPIQCGYTTVLLPGWEQECDRLFEFLSAEQQTYYRSLRQFLTDRRLMKETLPAKTLPLLEPVNG